MPESWKSTLFRVAGRISRKGSLLAGPPIGGVVSAQEWVQSRQTGCIHPSYPPYHYVRTPPFGLDPVLHKSFQMELQRLEAPGTFVLELHGGRIWGSQGSVLTPDDCLIAELSPEFRKRVEDYGVFQQNKLGPLENIEGTTCSLASPAGQVYGHWMMDVLPKLAILENAGFDWNKVDYFFVNGMDLPFQKRSLDLLGISGRCIDGNTHRHVRAEYLLAPSMPAVSGNMPAWAADFLRDLFLPNARDPGLGKRIYISRKKAARRKIVNENEIVRMLEGLGFKTVTLEDLKLEEQVGTFSEADWVIGPNGSSMFNLAFCHKGARVIELFSESSVNVCQWAIANLVPVHYGYLLGNQVMAPQTDPHEYDYSIDTEQLLQLVDHMSGI